MDFRKLLPPGLLLVGALLFFSPTIAKQDWSWLPGPIVAESLEGKVVMLVYEQLDQSPEVTLAMRGQDSFVSAQKLAQFLAVDDDDDFALPVVDAARTQGIEPPVLAVATKDGDSYKVHKIRKFNQGLEDILK